MRTYVPREWPTLARGARDSAAEDTAAALRNIIEIAENLTDPNALHKAIKAVNYCQNALRHLESAGAKTRPP